MKPCLNCKWISGLYAHHPHLDWRVDINRVPSSETHALSELGVCDRHAWSCLCVGCFCHGILQVRHFGTCPIQAVISTSQSLSACNFTWYVLLKNKHAWDVMVLWRNKTNPFSKVIDLPHQVIHGQITVYLDVQVCRRARTAQMCHFKSLFLRALFWNYHLN